MAQTTEKAVESKGGNGKVKVGDKRHERQSKKRKRERKGDKVAIKRLHSARGDDEDVKSVNKVSRMAKGR